MGIWNTILRSRDDLVKPKEKSYWGFDLEVEKKRVEELIEEGKVSPSIKRALKHELSGGEPVAYGMVLGNSNKEMGRLTTVQVKDILDDMGFNVDVILSKPHYSDFAAVMNINGFLIPGWYAVVKLVSERVPMLEKLLLTKLSPGKERLHVRVFELNNGSWLMVAHVDVNWMNYDLMRVWRGHRGSGGGDYTRGTDLMYELLVKFSEYAKKNLVFPFLEIVRSTRKWYYAEVRKKFWGRLAGVARS